MVVVLDRNAASFGAVSISFDALQALCLALELFDFFDEVVAVVEVVYDRIIIVEHQIILLTHAALEFFRLRLIVLRDREVILLKN